MPAASAPLAPPRHVLPVLVLAQLAGMSPWFAVNAVMPDLQREFGWGAATVGTLSTALQCGFVAGTLVFALLAVADRWSARGVFLACALLASACTLAATVAAVSLDALPSTSAPTSQPSAGPSPRGNHCEAIFIPTG